MRSNFHTRNISASPINVPRKTIAIIVIEILIARPQGWMSEARVALKLKIYPSSRPLSFPIQCSENQRWTLAAPGVISSTHGLQQVISLTRVWTSKPVQVRAPKPFEGSRRICGAVARDGFEGGWPLSIMKEVHKYCTSRGCLVGRFIAQDATYSVDEDTLALERVLAH
jgi:hypothetical protein